jgi:hypothetical protein
MVAKLLLNSLYGRFWMDDSFTKTIIISSKDYPKWEKEGNNKSSILNVLPLGDNYLVQTKNPLNEIKTFLDNGFETHNVNIGIASAVTAYSRIHMSQFKNNPNFPNLYYSDTDSVYFDGPLPESFISNTKLGGLKLEGIFDEAIFLASKVYALKNSKEEIVKIKGLSNKAIKKYSINLELFFQLLKKDSLLQFKQDKWMKHLSEGTIEVIKSSIYFKSY